MFTSRPTASPLAPVAPLGPIPLGGSLNGVQPSGPDLPLIGSDASGDLVLAEAIRNVSVRRLLMEPGAKGGLRLPRYTTGELASITFPEEALIVWDSTLHVMKGWNGSAYVAIGVSTLPAMDIALAGARTTDWTDAGAEIEVATFQVASGIWGVGRTLRFKATGRVTAGMTGRVRLYNTNTPAGPPSLLAQVNFADPADNVGNVLLGACPTDQIWSVKIALVGGVGAPDAFMFGGAALSVQAL